MLQAELDAGTAVGRTQSCPWEMSIVEKTVLRGPVATVSDDFVMWMNVRILSGIRGCDSIRDR